MIAYHEILTKIMNDGVIKENRTGVDTLAYPSMYFRHNMEDGFPLLTTRKMPIKSIAVELEGFIQGITSKKWYQERGCKYWDKWANPQLVVKTSMETIKNGEFAIHNNIAEALDDLGPMGYSYQMRRFNQSYSENDEGCLTQYDQLQSVVDTLNNNPNDRRMVVSLWNPVQLNQMALPPCTVAWNVTVIGNKLHLSWFQRSCDAVLGLPSDIASNALLLKLLSFESGIEAGTLTGVFVDCHIYKNHLDSAKLLLKRTPKDLPVFVVHWNGREKFDIFKWTHKDFHLENYNPDPKLDMGSIAV